MPKKKTHEEFLKEVYDLAGSEYEVIGTYVDATKKVEIKHNLCGNIYKVLPNSFLSGTRCPKCFGANKKDTNQFKQEVYNLVGDEYTILSEYISAHIKINIKHEKCGYLYMVEPSKFLTGRRCPYCAGKVTKTTNEFKKQLFNIYGNEYEVLSDYINTITKVEVKHNICGYIYKVLPSGILNGNKCPNCSRNKKKNTEEFKMEISNLVKDEYELLSQYTNAITKVTIKHNKCNNIYHVTPSNFLTGYRCPKCASEEVARKQTKTHDDFISEVYNLVGNDYTILGKYDVAKKNIQIIHNKCGHIFKMSPSNFLRGQRCPRCNESKGETLIREYLKYNNINFESQYKIAECKKIRPLPFDFAIFNNNNLQFLIEYDGELHYKEKGIGNDLKQQQQHDEIKNTYCRENNIPLLRIPYWEKNNLKQILDDYFQNL